MYQSYNGGWVEIICGCMFSGKSEELIRRIKRAQIAKQKVQAFCHAFDDRYGDRRVASHSGASLEALPVTTASEILALASADVQVVAIDEVQFFDPLIVDVCNELAGRGVRVIAAGLDLDFRGEPFGPMPPLLALAEVLDKLQAICMVCGASASRTQRLIGGRPAFFEDAVIKVGADEVYQARCRTCHEVPRKDLE